MSFAALLRLLLDDDGPTAAEYAVMLAFIVLAVFTIVQSLGTTVSSSFANSQLTSAS